MTEQPSGFSVSKLLFVIYVSLIRVLWIRLLKSNFCIVLTTRNNCHRLHWVKVTRNRVFFFNHLQYFTVKQSNTCCVKSDWEYFIFHMFPIYAAFRLLACNILFKRAVSPKSQQMLLHCDVWTWNIVAGTPHTCPSTLRSPPVCLRDDNLYRGCQREPPETTCKIIGVTWWPETLTDQTLHPINCW